MYGLDFEVEFASDAPVYELKTLDAVGRGFTATTDTDGALWVLVGTESGHEATTSLYYTRIRVELEPR